MKFYNGFKVVHSYIKMAEGFTGNYMIRNSVKPGKTLNVTVSDERDKIADLCLKMLKRYENEEARNRYATVRQLLALVGGLGAVAMVMMAPKSAGLVKQFLNDQNDKERNLWKRYNPALLRRTLRKLREQKLVKSAYQGDEKILELTENGRKRIIKYVLEDMKIDKPKNWDQKWRMVTYDIDTRSKSLRDTFRRSLKLLGFLQLQESVWLYPYPCEQEITFLREYYAVGSEVLYAVVSKLENDEPYRVYFGLV